MKTKKIQLEQFAFLTKNLEDDNEDYLESISPLIGKVVIYFNLLEERLTSFICQMISDRSDTKGLIITHNMTYTSKVDLLNRYAGHILSIYEKDLSEHNDFIIKLKESARLRNMSVHAEWNTIDKKGFAFVKLRFTSKKDIEQEFVQFDEDSIITIINYIIDTHNSFDDYEYFYYKSLGYNV